MFHLDRAHNGATGVRQTATGVQRRRDEALAFIVDRIVRTGTAPSYEEIGRGLRPRVSKARAQELVGQLIAEGVIEKTPGAQRALRVRDVSRARAIVDSFARALGWTVATPLGELEPPLPQVQLSVLKPFRHLPEADLPGES